VVHSLTKQMWADVLTKPLQGHQFYLMRSKLMGCPVYLLEEESSNAAAPLTSLTIKAGVQHDVSKAKAIKMASGHQANKRL
jgi:hypothetical protein